MWSGISGGSYKFTFTEPFATTPNITYTLKWDNGPHHNVYILSKSKTGFTFYGEHIGERGTYSRFRINWTATVS